MNSGSGAFIDSLREVPVHDPLWGHVYLPKSFIPIIESAPFVKLASIRQLGPVYLVYPGATHSRYSHSIGVYHIALRIMQQLCRIVPAKTFSNEGIISFLCAALCHDLGHFPFTHSLKELPLKDHEQLTAEILTTTLAPLLLQAGIDPAFCAAIVDHEKSFDHPELRWYRGFLSGVLDPDKLDYLSRDAYFCGLPFGAQDIDFVLRSISFDTATGLTVQNEGIRSIEHILFSKYLMYQSVYWHPRVRAATGMIKKAVHLALVRGQLKGEQLYGLTDAQFHTCMTEKIAEPSELVAAVFSGKLYSCFCQIPVSELNNNGDMLLNLDVRHEFENFLRQILTDMTQLKVRDLDLVLDIPEKISFEAGIHVSESGRTIDFRSSQTVFTVELIANFTQKLRFLRIFIKSDFLEKLEPYTSIIIQEIKQWSQNYA